MALFHTIFPSKQPCPGPSVKSVAFYSLSKIHLSKNTFVQLSQPSLVFSSTNIVEQFCLHHDKNWKLILFWLKTRKKNSSMNFLYKKTKAKRHYLCNNYPKNLLVNILSLKHSILKQKY